MLTSSFSLHHLIQYPHSASSPEAGVRYPTVLALHGLGSNEQDLIGLAPHLPDHFLWISPRAPLVFGRNSFEWYRVQIVGQADPEQIASALEAIDHFIDEILAAYPIDRSRLFLLGFSQGSILSMCYTLQKPGRVAGVVAQSGYIPGQAKLQIDRAGLQTKPFLLTHGEQDTVIPVEWARASRDRLQMLDVDLTYQEFRMGHSVSMDSLEVVSSWLERQLG